MIDDDQGEPKQEVTEFVGRFLGDFERVGKLLCVQWLSFEQQERGKGSLDGCQLQETLEFGIKRHATANGQTGLSESGRPGRTDKTGPIK